MFSLNESNRYWLCTQSVDMRKGFDSLCGVVISTMGQDPLSGDVFIFYNSSLTRLKLLHWERGGLVIYHKRLERGRISLPLFDAARGSYTFSWRDLVMLVEGISLRDIKQRKRYNFTSPNIAKNSAGNSVNRALNI